MKQPLILLALIVLLFSSCSSSYKTGQTPDDVYFSPTKSSAEYVRSDDRDRSRRYDDADDEQADDYYTDRYLRMRVNNRNQWSALDDYYFNNAYAYNSFGYSGIGYSPYMSFNNPWNSYYSWNNYYNPYYSSYYGGYAGSFYGGYGGYGGLGYGGYGGYGGYYPGVIVLKNTNNFRPPSRPVSFGNGYYSPNAINRSDNGINRPANNSYYRPSRNVSGRYNNSNNSGRNYSSGNNSSNNNYTPQNSTPSRSYSPSSNNSSNSSNSGSGNGRSTSSPAPSSGRPPR